MHQCPECDEDCDCEPGEIDEEFCQCCPLDEDDDEYEDEDYADEERRGGSTFDDGE